MRHVLAASMMLILGITAQAQTRQDTNPSHDSRTYGGLGSHKDKKDKAPTSRMLKGTVTDAKGHPLEGALVTVMDTNSKSKRTFITKDDGRYNFADLSFSVDYDLTARYKDVTSESRKLSQYDRQPNMVRIIQLSSVGQEAKAAQ